MRRILEDLRNANIQIVTWQEMLRSTNGLIHQECTETLARATTARAAGILLEQQSGLLAIAFQQLSPVEGSDPKGVWTEERRTELKAHIQGLLRWAQFGIHLSQPWRVVLAGRPNVGKSSLINALMGFARSIVFDQPGTTRDAVMAETAFDGWPVELYDTAGLRESEDQLEAAGIERARGRLASADCRVLLLDVSQPPQQADLELLQAWPDAIVVAHKCDLPNVWGDIPEGAVHVSSVTREGIDDLISQMVHRLVPEAPPSGTPLPITVRQVDCLEQMERAVETGDLDAYLEGIRRLLG